MDQENKTNQKDTTTPWYKIPMVWLVIALPMIAVIASMTTIVIAVKHSPEVIEHNVSYKKENQKGSTEDIKKNK